MMLLRHTGIYLAARMLVGGAGFAVMAVYTRVLGTNEFGELTLALTGVAFLGLLAVEGPYSATLRYLPEHKDTARAITLWGVTIPLVVLCLVAAAALALFAPDRARLPCALSAILLAATVLHRFQLTIAQGTLRAWQYTWLGSAESLLEMAFGISLVMIGYGVAGALWGAIAGLLLVIAMNRRLWWVDARLFDGVLWRQMQRFALPLSAGAVLGWFATFSDRWLIAAFGDMQQAGLYAAAYDLPLNLLGVPLMVMMLAGYPLTISAYAKSGAEAARAELRRLGTFIVLVLLPASVGLVLVGPLLVNIFLGEAFRPLALSLLPLLSAALFVKSLIYYLNYGYLIAMRSDRALLPMAAAASCNLAFNLVLIPRYGALGAAIAALAAFLIGFVVSIVGLRPVFRMPSPDPAVLASALLGTAAMVAWLWPFYTTTHWTALLYVLPVAIVIYGSVVLLVLQVTGREPMQTMRQLRPGAKPL